MATTKPSGAIQSKQVLLVEGLNDQHVIWNLAEKYKIAETFSVDIPKNGGISSAFERFRVGLKQQKVKTLGIVIDADQDIDARWQAIKNILSKANCQEIPEKPPSGGWVQELSQELELPRLGVWLMPDNQSSGMLEDFVLNLISPDDLLLAKAKSIIHEIEQENLNQYKDSYRSKVLIHTWLAWQEKPGQPMGQAIKKILQVDNAIAAKFVDWLNQLFNPTE
ncbi:MAG: DUF3226 domain-containing protein [Snowella sp.]|nr:DUF3226 domain-containing protein [Snowella sp.]